MFEEPTFRSLPRRPRPNRWGKPLRLDIRSARVLQEQKARKSKNISRTLFVNFVGVRPKAFFGSPLFIISPFIGSSEYRLRFGFKGRQTAPRTNS